jgi:serine phosphatase RsbU (regulator of sigma subunit)
MQRYSVLREAESGAVQWMTSGVNHAEAVVEPTYDIQAGRLVWPGHDPKTARDHGCTELHFPDGERCLLWAASAADTTLDLDAIAAHIQQHLTTAYKHRQEVDHLAAQLLDTYEEINLFYELADAFEVATDESHLGDILLTRALAATNGQGGAVVVLDDDTPAVVAVRGALSTQLTTQPLQRFPALTSALERGVAHNLGTAPEVHPEQPDRPTLIAPVLIKQQPVGAVVLQKQTVGPFSAGDMKVLRSLSAYAGVFLNNLRQAQRLVEAARLQQQLEFAETVQRQLLPAVDLQIPGLDVAVAYLASNKVGGDYYDVFDMAPHAVGVVIADVSGHSIASGLLMTAARSAIRLLFRRTSQPAKILQQLNDTLYGDLDQTDLFISIFLAIIDCEAHVVRYASAGHNPSLLYRQATGAVLPLDATGFLIGFAPDASFDECEHPFGPGDTLVLYTDGITEARSPDEAFYGEHRLHTRVAEIGHGRARGILGSIMTDVRQHSQNRLDDDMTLLVLKLATDD